MGEPAPKFLQQRLEHALPVSPVPAQSPVAVVEGGEKAAAKEGQAAAAVDNGLVGHEPLVEEGRKADDALGRGGAGEGDLNGHPEGLRGGHRAHHAGKVADHADLLVVFLGMPAGRVADRVDVDAADIPAGIIAFEGFDGAAGSLNEPDGVAGVRLVDDAGGVGDIRRCFLAPFRFVGAFPQSHAGRVLELLITLRSCCSRAVSPGLMTQRSQPDPGTAPHAMSGGGLLVAEFGFERFIIPARAAGAHKERTAVAELGISVFAVGGLGVRGRDDGEVDREDLVPINDKRASWVEGDPGGPGQRLGAEGVSGQGKGGDGAKGTPRTS